MRLIPRTSEQASKETTLGIPHRLPGHNRQGLNAAQDQAKSWTDVNRPVTEGGISFAAVACSVLWRHLWFDYGRRLFAALFQHILARQTISSFIKCLWKKKKVYTQLLCRALHCTGCSVSSSCKVFIPSLWMSVVQTVTGKHDTITPVKSTAIPHNSQLLWQILLGEASYVERCWGKNTTETFSR